MGGSQLAPVHVTTVHTDGWTGYNGLRNDGYVHEKTILSSSGDPAHVAMPGVHRVVSLLNAGSWVPLRGLSSSPTFSLT